MLLIIYQIYFVNWLCYRVPIIQLCNERQSTDLRQNVLVMALVSCLYNVVHYNYIDYGDRAKFNSIVEILRTDVLILITFYYLRCASEEILKRSSYLIYKKVIAIFFVLMTVVMISGGIVIFLKL